MEEDGGRDLALSVARWLVMNSPEFLAALQIAGAPEAYGFEAPNETPNAEADNAVRDTPTLHAAPKPLPHICFVAPEAWGALSGDASIAVIGGGLGGVAAALVVLGFGLATSLAADDEPFDYFRNSWNVVGLKDYRFGTRVTPENELMLAEGARTQIRYGQADTRLSRKQVKTLQEGWLPIIRLTAHDAAVRTRAAGGSCPGRPGRTSPASASATPACARS